MKKSNKLSEENLNKASGGTILHNPILQHNPDTEDHIVGYETPTLTETFASRWKPMVSTNSEDNKLRLGKIVK